MKMIRCPRLSAAAAAFLSLSALVLATNASAQILVNGSFETNTPGYGGVNTVVNGGVIAGWTVITTSGTSEVGVLPVTNYADNTTTLYPSAVDGSQFLAFNTRGAPAGTIEIYQDFATTPGDTYELTFTVGASSASVGSNQPVSLGMDVYDVVSGSTSGGPLTNATIGGTAVGATGEFFLPTTATFVATGSTSRILFSDLTVSTAGVDTLLDGVAISAVPEPAAFAAWAALGALALGLWHRRKTV